MYIRHNIKFRKLFIILISFIIIFNISVTRVSATESDTSSINVSATTAILMDYNTGKILYDKDSEKQMYPASTTKIMTAILTLENCDLEEKAIVSYDAVFSVPSGYTNANLQVDEELTINDLLHVLLIPSANDAANVLAEHIAGSIESFASMMNTKAIELGCKNTHFVNPSGIHNENHYSTAYDLTLMAKYAMQFDVFNEIVQTQKYTLPTSNKYDKEDRIFTTTNHLILKTNNNSDYYEYATGLKTGYTNAAKNCLVSSAEKDDMKLISVVLGCENNAKFSDAKTLFEYGFSNYSIRNLTTAGEVFKVISPSNSSKETPNLNVLYSSSINALVKSSELSTEFTPIITLDENLKAPIHKDSVIGKISYNIDGISYETDLIAGQDIYTNTTLSILLKILAVIVLLYIFASFISGKGNKTKSKNKQKKHRNSKHAKHSWNSNKYNFSDIPLYDFKYE